jgi:hypothetical protein
MSCIFLSISFLIFNSVSVLKTSKNHLVSSIGTAENARNILPYAIEDEKIEEYDENQEEEVSLIVSH